MKENQYTTYYKNRSLEELKEIAFQESLYEDEARLAALLVLKEREDTITEKEAIEFEKLNKKVAAKKVEQIEKAKAEEIEENKEVVLPELYSPIAIIGFSILFPLLFGGFLMFFNLRKLNKKAQAFNALLFCFCFMFLSGFLSVKFQFNNQWVFIVVNLTGAWLLVEYFWKKYIGVNLKFKKKSVLKVGLVSMVIYIFMMATLFFFFKDQIPAFNL